MMSAIPTIRMHIHPSYLHELKRDVWNDEGVPGVLKSDTATAPVVVSFRGNHIRKLTKKSYLIKYRKQTRKKTEFHLNAEYNDPSYIRNRLSFLFFEKIGVLSPKTSHVFLYLNKKQQGLYLKIESVDEHFLKRRNLESGAIYYAVDDDANFSLLSSFDKQAKQNLLLGYEKKLGSPDHDRYLEEFIYFVNTAKDDIFEKDIKNYLNVKQYLLWLIGVVCTQNFDGFVHNYALYLNEQTNTFQIIPWDYDATWGRNINGEKMNYDRIPLTGYNTLSARLLDIPAFQSQYFLLMRNVLQHDFTIRKLSPYLLNWHTEISPYLEYDPYTNITTAHLEDEQKQIFDYIEKRKRFLLLELSRL
ncbi:CotH kinase family protein [Bacillus sp. CLL-7-23]|uniref:CotH kinase family protein n=2 Tax=Bacillus changyiensis TaxID=3004103 RepID=A0ABT4X186_9BACI|nr:CotH kinase family protein [Bacillus changyiensis]MDA7026045.1 CotH kinase family protein [Bacillus changyiensis]